MKSLLEQSKNSQGRILKRNEMVQLKGGGDDCYFQLDNVFEYCIITDGVPYGVWSGGENGLCVDEGAGYCSA